MWEFGSQPVDDTRVSGTRVCVVGQHELDYPRNVVNQRLMQAAGYELVLCHSRARGFGRTLSILRQYLSAARSGDIVFMTEGSHRHVLWLRLAAALKGNEIIFDPFISLYNTEVEDRRLHRPWSFKGQLARFRDFASCWSADCLVFDTHEHKEYFYRRYGLRKPFRILRVGVDEQVFRPRALPPGAAAAPCQILFYGTYIPLQGIDVIIAAADRLRACADLRFTLIGQGQERPRIAALAERLQLPHVTFLDNLPPEALAEHIARADVCLGIFDAEQKASQVVPNKVVQSAAMQKPIITRSSPAIARYFAHEESAWLVVPNDPAALASAIERLAGDPVLRERLARGARAVFEREFSIAAQTPIMRELLAHCGRSARSAAPPAPK